jgi:hypothetical protein
MHTLEINVKTGLSLFFGVFALFFAASGARAGDLDNYNLSCSGGSYVAGLKLRMGAWVDQVGIMCTNFDERTGTFGRAFDPGLEMAGGSGGAPHNFICPTGTFLDEIFSISVRPGGAGDLNLGSVLDNMVLVCRGGVPPTETELIVNTDSDTTGNQDMRNKVIDANTPSSGSFPAYGLDEPPKPSAWCTGDRIPAGIHGSLFRNSVMSIVFNCKKNPLQDSGDVGTTSQGLSTDTRPPPPPPPQGPIDTSSGAASFPLGLGSGPQIDVDCSAGEALVGLQAQGTAYIDLVQIHCARFDGHAITGPLGHRGVLGSSTAAVRVADCSGPSVVVAGEGDTTSFQNLVTRVALRCSNGASSSYVGATAPVNMQTWTHRILTCGPGNVAVGIYGWLNSDRTLKAFGFRCKAASSFSGGGAHRFGFPDHGSYRPHP